MCLRDRLQTDQVLILSSESGEEKNGWSFGKVLMGPTSTALDTTENNDMHLHHENPPLLMHFVTALNRTISKEADFLRQVKPPTIEA